MAYVSKQWTDFDYEYPNRYTIVHEDLTEEVVYIRNNFGTERVTGNAWEASEMNNMESRIDAAFDSDEDAIEDAAGVNIADVYDPTSTYDVGDYVVHGGLLYKCNTAIASAEAWTVAHWTRCLVTEEMAIPTEVTVTGTLVAGATSITLSDAAIETTSWVMPWASVFGVMPVSVVVATGSVTLTFEAQSSDMTVGVVVK